MEIQTNTEILTKEFGSGTKVYEELRVIAEYEKSLKLERLRRKVKTDGTEKNDSYGSISLPITQIEINGNEIEIPEWLCKKHNLKMFVK